MQRDEGPSRRNERGPTGSSRSACLFILRDAASTSSAAAQDERVGIRMTLKEPLYTREILRLAASIPYLEPFEELEGATELRSPTCGSRAAKSRPRPLHTAHLRHCRPRQSDAHSPDSPRAGSNNWHTGNNRRRCRWCHPSAHIECRCDKAGTRARRNRRLRA